MDFCMALVGLLILGGICLILDPVGLYLLVVVVGAVVIAMLLSLQKRQNELNEKLDRLLKGSEPSLEREESR